MPYYTAKMVKYLHGKSYKDELIFDDDYENIALSIASGIIPSTFENLPDIRTPKKKAPTPKAEAAKDISVSKKTEKKRALRVTPSFVDVDPTKAPIDCTIFDDKPGEQNFDERRLLYMRNLLRLQVDRITRLENFSPISEKFYMYDFDINQELPIRPTFGRIFKARHKDFPEIVMLGRMFEGQGQEVGNPIYFKILRHLGKKHPYIIQTWDVFLNTNEQVFVFQEYANRGDLDSCIKKNGAVEEPFCSEWARQLYRALDYLGDMGVCHRTICPSYVLLNHRDFGVRLTGFYNAIIYWNVNKNCVINLPCWPLENQNREVPDFQAPEVYGNKETELFDPVQADIWSYGAVIYFMISAKYPYEIKSANENLEQEIQENIKTLQLSQEGENFLADILHINATTRKTEKLINSPWFAKFRNG